ncbi:hypothetical protein [Streptomyces hydrogenans]|uniref:hypothetical protein n=1 Tax=Streptomyces hydrogenans TaxID=1873719 RepID=UPI003824DBE2
MTHAAQYELWTDDWEAEADEQAAHDLHTPAHWPLYEYGRACGGPRVPQHRAIDDVLETL